MTAPMWQMCGDDWPLHLRGEYQLPGARRPGLPEPRPDLDDEAEAKRYYDGQGD